MFREYMPRIDTFLATQIKDLKSYDNHIWREEIVIDGQIKYIIHLSDGATLYSSTLDNYLIFKNDVYSIMDSKTFYTLYELSIEEQISDAEFDYMVGSSV